ncbi:glycosyltransferase [Amphibacillus xylanus]|uniref:Putative glycosyltransferase n=1 Tax=Amphibacillus xylanus (strain ATCC 51415 / DSM 6626 / JCM 7361 / LMG 17667 / NBRC 15112 / Ep01) TaxID=698758 RepID=K0J4G4_AMPXN|nr:glycosyltransferase [Amphibacillus xylanus]BAM48137.1 putative glycosyltransferase [Amphibacillus xylanus NBRC 15112]
MRLAFAHDHLFQEDEQGNLYTGGSFNNQAWKRYLNHFDEIIVLARKEKLDNKYNNKTYNNFDLKETKLEPVPSISGPIKQFSNKKEAEDIIRKTLIDSDALIARLPSETGNLAIRIAKKLNKPYAVEVVACVWDALWNHGSLMGKIYAPIAMHKMKKKVYESPYTLYVTNEFLQKRYPTKGKTTNVSNVEISSVFEKAYEIRNSRLEGKTIYKIGMIGSLKNRIKGWDVALNALSILKSNGIDFEFHILGDGEVEQWANLADKLGIRDKVKFCGVLPGGEPVLNWLDEMDLYIQPSFQEGLPRAVIEAMSRGCPVVGSNAGGIPELIDLNCIHKAGEYKDLAASIEKAISNKEYSMMLTKQNIEASKQYEKSELDKKRNEFWASFINEIDRLNKVK